MSYQAERDAFIARMSQEGLPLENTRRLLRYATTLHRLAEASCNGDWPCDNGERAVIFCPRCEGGMVKSMFRRSSKEPGVKVCVDCRTGELVSNALPDGFAPIINGDPRGALLMIKVPSESTNDWGQRGIYVPTR